MNISDLDPKEIKYIVTLEWSLQLTYLEKKYGTEFKNKFKNRIRDLVESEVGHKVDELR